MGVGLLRLSVNKPGGNLSQGQQEAALYFLTHGSRFGQALKAGGNGQQSCYRQVWSEGSQGVGAGGFIPNGLGNDESGRQ